MISAGRHGRDPILAAVWLGGIERLLCHGFYPRRRNKQLNPTQAMGDYFCFKGSVVDEPMNGGLRIVFKELVPLLAKEGDTPKK
jgi:hypothetical protein